MSKRVGEACGVQLRECTDSIDAAVISLIALVETENVDHVEMAIGRLQNAVTNLSEGARNSVKAIKRAATPKLDEMEKK